MDKKYVKADFVNLKAILFEGEREIYSLECVNLLHLYTVCFAINKIISGDKTPVDALLFYPKR